MLAQFTGMLLLTMTLSSGDALSKPRLEQLLADGDDDIVVAVFRRHEERILPFVDQYLEGGLKIIEDGGDQAEAMKRFRMGIRFAKLGDQAAPGASFVEYATNFASWTAREQVEFRKGQAEYRRGREIAKSDPSTAAEHFRASAVIASSLGDLWGAAMSYTALARAELDAGRIDKVDEAARQANELNPKLRQRQATIRTLVVWGDAQANQQNRGFGMTSYQYAWSLLRSDDPQELRHLIGEQLARALDRAGQPAQAAEIRQKAGLASPDAAQDD